MPYAKGVRPGIPIRRISGQGGLWISPSHQDLLVWNKCWNLNPDQGFPGYIPFLNFMLKFNPSRSLETEVFTCGFEQIVTEALGIKIAIGLI